MNISIRAVSNWGTCRYCKGKTRWTLTREHRYSADRLCHEHLGVALRNLGLRGLDLVHTAHITAEVRP